MIELDRHKFREYLEDFDKCEIIGSTRDPFSCVIARYLNTLKAGITYVVNSKYIDENLPILERDFMRTPKWAKMFIVEQDRTVGRFESAYQPVEAGEALLYLDRVDKRLSSEVN